MFHFGGEGIETYKSVINDGRIAYSTLCSRQFTLGELRTDAEATPTSNEICPANSSACM